MKKELPVLKKLSGRIAMRSLLLGLPLAILLAGVSYWALSPVSSWTQAIGTVLVFYIALVVQLLLMSRYFSSALRSGSVLGSGTGTQSVRGSGRSASGAEPTVSEELSAAFRERLKAVRSPSAPSARTAPQKPAERSPAEAQVIPTPEQSPSTAGSLEKPVSVDSSSDSVEQKSDLSKGSVAPVRPSQRRRSRRPAGQQSKAKPPLVESVAAAVQKTVESPKRPAASPKPKQAAQGKRPPAHPVPSGAGEPA